MKKLWTVMFLAVLWLGAGAAEMRIAVIDMEHVFRNYYKSKIAEESIRSQAEIYRNYLLKLNEDNKKLDAEYKIARDAAQNIALSGQERTDAEAKAARLERELKGKLAEQEQYALDKNRKMKELEVAKRSEIMADIAREVKKRALSEGYDLVLDSSGKTLNAISAVVYHRDGIDLTAGVLAELNRTDQVKHKEHTEHKEHKEK